MMSGGSNSFCIDEARAAAATEGYLNLQGFLMLPASDATAPLNLHISSTLQQAAAPAQSADHQRNPPNLAAPANNGGAGPPAPSRYESQKRRDWNTFGQYLRNHRPPLALPKCSGAHVLEFLRYLDQFGKTKVHTQGCPFFGHPQPPAACACPLRQAWGSLDALIGRLRAAFEENGGKPESNPFGARAVRLYLRDVRESQAKARGIAYEKKKRKKPPPALGTAPSTTDHHHNHHQAAGTGVNTGAPSSFLSSHTQQGYAASSNIAHVGINHHENKAAGAGGPLNQPSTLGIPPNQHSYHHHHILSQAPACPSPPPLIPSFN
ncbi:hypothetical protein GOP47_0019193 [Adiantum capillus-veneris]|uniref:ALOG domain-containing protein n=1 Tax=Adiantum capillus-veneris TaxID=13818 RepID=A0A9D4UFU2_ADICA|nr:hypothetical protein GOP47_0019193 [Adiantum capillus-veneris]